MASPNEDAEESLRDQSGGQEAVPELSQRSECTRAGALDNTNSQHLIAERH
jgi:hypothetical protein